MLDVEPPNPRRAGNEDHRQLDHQQRPPTDQHDQTSQHRKEHEVGAQPAAPRPRTLVARDGRGAIANAQKGPTVNRTKDCASGDSPAVFAPACRDIPPPSRSSRHRRRDGRDPRRWRDARRDRDATCETACRRAGRPPRPAMRCRAWMAETSRTRNHERRCSYAPGTRRRHSDDHRQPPQTTGKQAVHRQAQRQNGQHRGRQAHQAAPEIRPGAGRERGDPPSLGSRLRARGGRFAVLAVVPAAREIRSFRGLQTWISAHHQGLERLSRTSRSDPRPNAPAATDQAHCAARSGAGKPRRDPGRVI